MAYIARLIIAGLLFWGMYTSCSGQYEIYLDPASLLFVLLPAYVLPFACGKLNPYETAKVRRMGLYGGGVLGSMIGAIAMVAFYDPDMTLRVLLCALGVAVLTVFYAMVLDLAWFYPQMVMRRSQSSDG